MYWALRGGGNNFGIITNFKLSAFPLGQMWGGQRIYTENNFPAVLDAIYKFATTGSATDTDAAQIVVSTTQRRPNYERLTACTVLRQPRRGWKNCNRSNALRASH
jgi:hypothetical protein